LDFVRPILLDDGARKNSLFLLTKNQIGMLEMNKLAFKNSDDGKGINIKDFAQKSLFGTEETNNFMSFYKELEELILKKKEINSKEILFFTIKEGFLPKHATTIIRDLKKFGKIKIFDKDSIQTNKLNLSEKPKYISYYKYII